MISTVVPTLQGWCSVERASALFSIVIARKPKMVLEIGTHAGRSFLPMCWALRRNGRGKAMGIDAYSGQVAAQDETPSNAEFWGDQSIHNDARKTFEWLMKRYNMDEIVQLIVSPSDAVTPVESEVLHIDGSHVEANIRDAERFGAKVPLGGIVIMDDIQWTLGCVLRAIDTLEEMGFEEVFRSEDGSWNIMHKVK